ncbi:restriction endonuclease subunit R [Flavobacteriaceae bacterium R38]|nr:restriction endonuclease subunit R [Flavobacteriaceae bacterium R38]
MQQLNFPKYQFRFKNSENKLWIFDIIRKKFVVLQPEEWVRQHVVHFLIEEKKIPKSLINVEKKITVNGLTKRFDIVVFHSSGKINMVIECKSPSVSLDQKTFDQIARYNSVLNSDFLMVTNGLQHIYCKMDYRLEKYIFLKDIPSYIR